MELYKKKVILYGLGTDFNNYRLFYEKYFDVIGYSDQKKKDIENFIFPNHMKNYAYNYIYVCTRQYRLYNEIRNELVEDYSFDRDCVITYYDIQVGEFIKEELQKIVDWRILSNFISDYGTYFKMGKTNLSINLCYNYSLPPLYNDGIPSLGYSTEKEKKRVYIRDRELAHIPYCGSKYFSFDRYNYGLETHFYTHKAMDYSLGTPKNKYGVFFESRSILPYDYDWILNRKDLWSEYDVIFTYEQEMLERIPNAHFRPAARASYGDDVLLDEKEWDKCKDNYKTKTKMISIFSSGKSFCEMHKFRNALAKECLKFCYADVYGSIVDNRYLSSTKIVFEDYMFSIVIENDNCEKYYFTEKILDCFINQTIPIYLGASDIGKFFNSDGIIQLKKGDIDDIAEVLKVCTEKYYYERLDAVIDNYRIVKKYLNVWDYMYEDYFLNHGIL